MLYSLVIDGVPGLPGALPGRFRMPDGSTRTDLDTWTPEELAGIGYYSVTEIRPGYDPETEQLVGPDMAFDGEEVAATWTAEDLPEAEPVTSLSKLDFLNRFTDAELTALKGLESSNSSVGVFWEKFRAAEYLNLADERTIASVQALEDGGFLATGRAAEILTP